MELIIILLISVEVVIVSTPVSLFLPSFFPSLFLFPFFFFGATTNFLFELLTRFVSLLDVVSYT